MATNVLHGYYELGGETIRDAAFTIGAALNARIPAVPLAIERSVPDADSADLVKSVVHSYSIPAFQHDDPGRLKLPLFFVKGHAGKVEYVRAILSQKMPQQMDGHRGAVAKTRTEGESINKFLQRYYDFQHVVFNGLSFQYEGLDLAHRPMGGIRLQMDTQAQQNQGFFSARQAALRAIRAISTRVQVETSDSIRIGGVNMRHTTPESIERLTSGIAHEIRDKPIEAQIGSFILKNKILDSDH